jgi:hypothetical protein
MNQSFRDSRAFLLRYQSLQSKAVEIIKSHITTTLSSAAQRLNLASRRCEEDYESNIYVKYMSVAPGTKRLFQLSEKTPAFGDILSLYRQSRLNLLTPILSSPQLTVPDLRSKATVVFTVVRKEYELKGSKVNTPLRVCFNRKICRNSHLLTACGLSHHM